MRQKVKAARMAMAMAMKQIDELSPRLCDVMCAFFFPASLLSMKESKHNAKRSREREREK